MFLFLDGFIGKVLILFDGKGAPPFEKEGDRFVFRVPNDGLFFLPYNKSNGRSESRFFMKKPMVVDMNYLVREIIKIPAPMTLLCICLAPV